MRHQFPFLASLVFAAALAGCSAAPNSANELTNGSSTYNLSANDLQGAPLQLANIYKGNCIFHYSSGQASNSCQADLQASQDPSQVSLVVHATIDGQEHDLTTGNYRIYGNRIEDDRGLSVGAVGQTGLRMSSPDFGSMSLKFLENDSVGLLINDFTDLKGDHSKGAAFAAKLTLPSQN